MSEVKKAMIALNDSIIYRKRVFEKAFTLFVRDTAVSTQDKWDVFKNYKEGVRVTSRYIFTSISDLLQDNNINIFLNDAIQQTVRNTGNRGYCPVNAVVNLIERNYIGRGYTILRSGIPRPMVTITQDYVDSLKIEIMQKFITGFYIPHQ